MAKARIDCATPDCSHKITIYGGNRKDTDRKAEWAESEGFICEDCKENQRQEGNDKAAQANASAGLPELTGSEKQIAWAETIRAEKLSNIEKEANKEFNPLEAEAYYGDDQSMTEAQQNHAVRQIKRQTSASWWIDNRTTKAGHLLAQLFKQKPPIAKEEQAHIDEAQAEATVRPEQVETETIAEITLQNGHVKVDFPQKIEALRLIMRKNHYTWTGSLWSRGINAMNGIEQDRLAEIGHILLGSGFIIRIYDPQSREKAIQGNYQEEQTRWIIAYSSSANDSSLGIRWGRDEDYYKQAKRLPTARYVRPGVSVSPEQFEEILDFAEINDFAISASAEQVIDQARNAKEKALTVSVERVQKKPPTKPSDKPGNMVVPDGVGVDESLLDD